MNNNRTNEKLIQNECFTLKKKKKKTDKQTKQKEEKIEGAFTLKFLIIFVIFNGPSIIKTQRHGGIRKKLNFLLGKPQENLTEK